MRSLIVMGMAAAAVLTAGGASAQQSRANTDQCLNASNWGDWKATPDGRTIYVQGGLNRVWRFDLQKACPELNAIGARLAQRTQRQFICRPMDVNIRVVRPGLSIAQCNIASITRMKPDEIAALPRDLRPFPRVARSQIR